MHIQNKICILNKVIDFNLSKTALLSLDKHFYITF